MATAARNWSPNPQVHERQKALQDEILAAAKQRGITQPEYEWLRSTGAAFLIEPDMLKENSRAWFNKPYDGNSPEGKEFRKHLLDTQGMPGMTPSGGTDWQTAYQKEWGQLHAGDLTDEDKALARRLRIDFTTPEGVWKLTHGDFFNGVTPMDPRGREIAAEWRKLHPDAPSWELGRPMTLGGVPEVAPVATSTVIAPPATPAPAVAPNTFLPPYLQPGADAAGDPSTIAPAGQTTVPLVGAPPITPLGSPMTPFVPQAFVGQPLVTPGLLPAMAGMPSTSFGGGFAATAKLLELPFYLQNFGKPRRGIYGR